MNWINVNDRLPEDRQEVLIFATGVAFGNNVYAVCEYIASSNEFNQFDLEADCYCMPTVDVSHWMPLERPLK